MAYLAVTARDPSTSLEMTRLLSCRDAQIRFLIIPSVTESEVERRRIGLLVEFAQPWLIMLFEHVDGAEINAKETQIPLVRVKVGKRNA